MSHQELWVRLKHDEPLDIACPEKRIAHTSSMAVRSCRVCGMRFAYLGEVGLGITVTEGVAA